MTYLLTISLALLSGLAASAGDEWNKNAAKNRLDERAEFWFQEGKQLKTDLAGKVACLCCHNTVPYALARPFLQKAMGHEEPAPLTRLLKDVARRVKSCKTHQRLYDHDKAKEAESRGTEAILSSLILASYDEVRGLKTPSPETVQAFECLWQYQRANGTGTGAWDWLKFGLEPWETADAEYYGAALAAYAVGTAPGYYDGCAPQVERRVTALRGYLSSHRANQGLYNRVWLLLASTRLSGLLTDQQKKDLIAEIRTHQTKGGWSLKDLGPWRYSGGGPPQQLAAETDQPDGYATGLVIYTLRRVGVSADDDAVRKGIAWLRGAQLPSGAWPAFSINKKRAVTNRAYYYMSDAATAWAVLALLQSEVR